MNQSAKVVTVIIVLLLLAIGGLWVQLASSRIEPAKLSSSDVELLVTQLVSPQRQRDLADSADKRAEFIKELKTVFAVAQAARKEGYLDRNEISSQIKVLFDQEMYAAYNKKHADAEASDAEIAEYYKQNPGAFERFLANNPRFQAPGADREALRRDYGQLRVLSDRAVSEGLDKADDTRVRVQFKTAQYLFSEYQRDLKKKTDAAVTDEEIKQYYRDHQEEFEEVRARHILIATAATEPSDQSSPKPSVTIDEARKIAQGLRDRIMRGEDFAKVAEERSDDPGSKVKGGDLGYFLKGQMTPPFEAVAFSLPVGQVSELVETEFGIHIIKVEGRRTSNLDSKTQQTIGNKLKQERLIKMLERVAANEEVDVPNNFNITAPAAASGSPSIK